MADLTQRLEASEIEAQRMADALEQMTAHNSALERDVQALQNDNDRLRSPRHFPLILMNGDLQFWSCSKIKSRGVINGKASKAAVLPKFSVC